jgi:hypothetical protein
MVALHFNACGMPGTQYKLPDVGGKATTRTKEYSRRSKYPAVVYVMIPNVYEASINGN